MNLHSARHEMMETRDSNLLLLPKNLRHRIYEYVGLPKGQLIDLNATVPAPEWTCPWFAPWNAMALEPESACLAHLVDTRHLLLTCRFISDEVSFRLYQDNIFLVLFRDKVSKLRCLENLRGQSLRAMTWLMVCHAGSCHGGSICRMEDWQGPGTTFDKPADKNDEIIAKWNSIWLNHIVPNITLGQLKFEFRYDMDSLESARGLARCFLTTTPCPPLLRECKFRLGAISWPDLTTLAQQVVDHLTHPRFKRTGHFRFMDLPTEIRLQILEYTDLVSPAAEVQWDPLRGYSYARVLCNQIIPEWDSFQRNGHGEIVTPWEHSHQYGDYDLRNPGPHRVDLLHDWNRGEHACQFISCNRRAFPSRGFCTIRHAAASSDPKCRCWEPPTAVFLVSRAFRDQAREVFFSKNRIALLDMRGLREYNEYWPAPISRPIRLHCAMFFRTVMPRQSLRWLRFVEIVFPPIRTEESVPYAEPASITWQDWLAAIALLQNHANLESLTIRAYFAKHILQNGGGETSVPFLRDLTIEQEAILQHACMDIARPLARLAPRLYRFCVHMDHLGECSRRYTDWDDSFGDRHMPSGYKRRARVKSEDYDPVARSIEAAVIGRCRGSELAGCENGPMLRWLATLLFDSYSAGQSYQ